MIIYLCAGTDEGGFADALGRGWERIARNRFVTPDKNDIRVIRRFADMIPMAGPTPMIQGSDFAKGKDAAEFEKFVASGRGEWVEGDEA